MAFGRAQDDALIVLGEGTQGIGARGAEGALVGFGLRFGREPCGQGITAYGPGLATAEEPRGGGEAQAVLVDEGMDDTGFIHRRGGTRGSIGAQEQELELRDSTGMFDHGGHELVPLVAPALEALEAIDDLEGAVRAASDADRQLRLIFNRARRGSMAAQRLEAEPQQGDGDVRHHG